ncbi:MAG: hypothetical protein V3W18_01885 [candidate division Zixibacteria bacterium]
MALAIAYQFIIGGVTLKMIKFPFVGGEIQFEKEEELPKGTVKIAVKQAKYIFDDNFILEVRPNERSSKTDDSFNVSFYKITGAKPENPRDLYESTSNMIPGRILSINLEDRWYHVRMLQIKKDGEDTYCYFHVYDDKEDVRR